MSYIGERPLALNSGAPGTRPGTGGSSLHNGERPVDSTSPSIGARPITGSGASIGKRPVALAISSSTRTLIARMVPAPPSYLIPIIDALNNGLIASGIMARADVIHFRAVQSSQAAHLNWKSTSFTSADGNTPQFFPYYGHSSDGIATTGGYVTENWAPTNGVNWTQDDACAYVFQRRYDQSSASPLGNIGATVTTLISPRNTSNQFVYRINQSTTSTGETGITDGFGGWAAERTGANATQAYHNGVAVGAAGAVASAALSSSNIALGRTGNTSYIQDQFIFEYLGASLGPALQATLHSLVNTAVTALGIASIAPPTVALTLRSNVTLPDASVGTAPGKGLTSTGMAYDPTDGTWWFSNLGKAQPADPAYVGSVCHVSADFLTLLGETTLLVLGVPASAMQGMAYDTSDNSIWGLGKAATSTIFNMSKAGALVSSFTKGANANGLAYDAARDQLPILDQGALSTTWNNTAGVAQSTIVAGTGDQVTVDSGAPNYFIRTVDGGVNGFIHYYDYNGGDNYISGLPLLQTIYTIDPVLSINIEGCVKIGDTFYVCSPSYYHGVGNGLNQALTYSV